MTKEELISVLENATTVSTLNRSDSHIFQVEVGDMTTENIRQFCTNLSTCLKNIGLNSFVIIPVSNGIGALNVYNVMPKALGFFN